MSGGRRDRSLAPACLFSQLATAFTGWFGVVATRADIRRAIGTPLPKKSELAD